MMKIGTPARERDSLADQLAQSIREKLQSNAYGDGDVFMTEAQLATEFDVSRTIVREAVSRLRALGILEGATRKGAGRSTSLISFVWCRRAYRRWLVQTKIVAN